MTRQNQLYPLYNIFPQNICLSLSHLCGDVGVLFPVAVAVVGVDVVTAHHPVHWLEDYAAVVISNHIGISGMEK